MLFDLIQFKVPVRLGGHLFFMRRISMAAVVQASARFSEKILQASQGGDLNAAKILASFTRADLADLFSWVLEPSDPIVIEDLLEQENGYEYAEQLVAMIQQLNDCRRIWDAMMGCPPAPTEPEPAAEQPVPGRPSVARITSMERLIEGIARRYGRPPHEVMEWPYEEVLEIAEIAALETEQQRQEWEKLTAAGARAGSPFMPGRQVNETRVDAATADPLLWLAVGGEYHGKRRKPN